jgi:hypothetical protein
MRTNGSTTNLPSSRSKQFNVQREWMVNGVIGNLLSARGEFPGSRLHPQLHMAQPDFAL